MAVRFSSSRVQGYRFLSASLREETRSWRKTFDGQVGVSEVREKQPRLPSEVVVWLNFLEGVGVG